MKKSLLAICLGLIVTLAPVSPVPAGPPRAAQGCDPGTIRVMIVIPETLVNSRPPDPAAETEMIKRFIDAGFTVLDSSVYEQFRYSDEYLRAVRDARLAQAIGQRFGVQAIIIGEGLGDITGRDGPLVISRARVEVRVIKTADATVIGAGDKEATARDPSGVIGAKAALRNAGGEMADELIVRMARHYNLCPHPRAISRASAAVIRFTAPGLPSTIDFSTILSDALTMLGTIDVYVAGQDLESVLSNIHAGTIPVPDAAITGTVERAEVRNVGVIPVGPIILYVNDVTLRFNVRAIDTETGRVLAAVAKEATRHGTDIVVSIAGITLGNFNRTVMGMMARDMLKETAEEIAPAVIAAFPKPTYFDIVTIKNGDRFSGTVTNSSFTLVTSFGQLNFPTNTIRSILVGNPSRITRADGSTFSGQILDAGLMVSGLGNIPMNQVATVVFAVK